MEIKVLNQNGSGDSNVSLPDSVFGQEFNADLVHQLVTTYIANGHQNTKCQKAYHRHCTTNKMTPQLPQRNYITLRTASAASPPSKPWIHVRLGLLLAAAVPAPLKPTASLKVL